jgi:hypothetical protein
MRIQFHPLNWTVGVSMIRDVPMAGDGFLCHHYEQAVCLWLGPLVIRWWFHQKNP